jgi:hypothetical protein
MEINRTTTIAATVTNDGSNSGVDWSCAPANSCGTFTPAHTASGGTTVYQAPASSGNVTITAASTKKPTATASATVTINPIGSTANLTGTYTFFANGWDFNGNATSVAGTIVLSGTGNVTGGEQDFFNAATPTIIMADPIPAGGTINLGSDGRGTITITPINLNITETFSVVLVNNKHLLITEFDGNATSAGAMDFQTAPASVPTGGNAFSLLDTWDIVAFGGVITSNGTMVTDAEADADDAGSQSFDFTFSGDSITAPDAQGRGTISLDGLLFAYYVVGPEAFRLIEIDGASGGFLMTGSMFGQGTAAGTYSAVSLQGRFAFGQAGETSVGIGFYGAAGQFTTDGASAFTSGVADVNAGDGAPVLAGDLTAGSFYAVASNGYGYITLPGTTTDGLANFGIYMVDPNLNIADPNSSTGGGGALMTDLDVNSLGTGIVVRQATGATFAGNYAFNEDGAYQTSTLFGFFDILGQVFSDGSSSVAGFADYNDVNNTGQSANSKLTGTFAADAAHPGRATAQVTLSVAATPKQLTIYQASNALLLHVDTGSSTFGIVGVGVLEKQQ